MTLIEMAVQAIHRIHETIGDCELVKRNDFNDCIWRQIEFLPEKFEDAIQTLIEDIKIQKIFYFRELDIPDWLGTNIHRVTGHGISIRMEHSKRYNVKKKEWEERWTIDYMGWPRSKRSGTHTTSNLQSSL